MTKTWALQLRITEAERQIFGERHLATMLSNADPDSADRHERKASRYETELAKIEAEFASEVEAENARHVRL